MLVGYPPSIVEASRAFKKTFQREEWQKVSPQARDLVTRMLKIDPDERITAQQLANHPWIRAKGIIGINQGSQGSIPLLTQRSLQEYQSVRKSQRAVLVTSFVAKLKHKRLQRIAKEQKDSNLEEKTQHS